MMLKRRVDALEDRKGKQALPPLVKSWLGWKLTESEKRQLVDHRDIEIAMKPETLAPDVREWLYGT